ncbi:MAG: hypothetical protein FWC65_05660 [Treponema sp.]|nr:hypothetical protein [Treponema sp.]
MSEIITITFNPIQTIALAVLAYLTGAYLVANSQALRKYCIPIPVVGGMLFALLIFMGKKIGLVNIVMVTQPIQELFMNIFFTTIGFGASLAVVKKGGRKVLILLVLAAGVAILQNALGIGIASIFGIHPLYGVAAGSVSMAGGHGTAGAFGPALEAAGAAGATAIALAAATIGLVIANLMGGPVATSNIDKYKLAGIETSPAGKLNEVIKTEGIDSGRLFDSFLLILLVMGIGMFLSHAIVRFTPITALPSYIGALLTGAIIRNVAEASGKITIHSGEVRCIGDIGISIFLAMAMVSLDLTQVAALAGPVLMAVLAILAAQTLLTFIITKFVVFNALGKDYEAGVLSGGFVGLQMGATPNAVAIMKSVTTKYHDAPNVFLILPIVSGFLLDLVNASLISVALNIFG